MPKTEIISLRNKIDETVSLSGWVSNARDHGNLVFIDLRDRSAIVQLVIFDKNLVAQAAKLHTEDLIEIEGKVQKRPPKLANPNLATGEIEVAVLALKIISQAAELPFAIDSDTRKINEQARLKYRYLDLRSERMRKNLEMRHKIILFLRNYLSQKGFWDVETPCLTKGTPEGAREFIVPSRLHAGNFYVLPQSPQQLKQLLMVGGAEKYFQVARCFRDEDQRLDRQPEFTQLDLEMSFVEAEDILQIIEEAMIKLVQEVLPEMKIQAIPFPRLTHQEVMGKYNSDKPDLRQKKEADVLAFCWVLDFPLFEKSETENKIVSCHHPFTHPKDEDLALLDTEPLHVRAKAYDLVLNGFEVGGGSIRIFERDLQQKIFEILGLTPEEIKARFGHMLEAFTFSPPPHGGIALGLDRLIAILLKEESIREVMAFPKTGDAKDLLTGAPSPVSPQALKDAHIKTDKKE
jgi:aspartyl-tRNA synthetase